VDRPGEPDTRTDESSTLPTRNSQVPAVDVDSEKKRTLPTVNQRPMRMSLTTLRNR
jgi:hypothetical protein